MEYIKRKCSVCSGEFSIPKFRLKHGRGQTCSKECRWKLHSRRQVGEGNAKWRGGISYHQGYKMIYKPSHPHAKGNGYVFEHRLIVEKSLGRYLRTEEIIHHINHDKLDNRVENLKVVTPSQHHEIHHRKFLDCSICGGCHFARNLCSKHYQQWYRKTKHQ